MWASIQKASNWYFIYSLFTCSVSPLERHNLGNNFFLPVLIFGTWTKHPHIASCGNWFVFFHSFIVTVYKSYDTSSLLSLVMYLPKHYDIISTVAALKRQKWMSAKGSWVRSNVKNYCIFMRNFSLSPSLNLCLTYGADEIDFIFCKIIHSLMTGFDPGSLLIFPTIKAFQLNTIRHTSISAGWSHDQWEVLQTQTIGCFIFSWPINQQTHSKRQSARSVCHKGIGQIL